MIRFLNNPNIPMPWIVRYFGSVNLCYLHIDVMVIYFFGSGLWNQVCTENTTYKELRNSQNKSREQSSESLVTENILSKKFSSSYNLSTFMSKGSTVANLNFVHETINTFTFLTFWKNHFRFVFFYYIWKCLRKLPTFWKSIL